MTTTPNLGELLPNVTVPMDAGDIVLDACIVMRVINTTSGDGRPGLHIATTPDLDWILQIGMLRAALDIASGPYGEEDDQ